MGQLLYINNELVDLYPNTVIAQTLQAFEIGALGSVRTNYTNRIRIPKTGRNRRVLGFSDDSKSSTSFPYTSHTAKFVQNGLEVIRNGVIVLDESGSDFDLRILSGPIGFFDFIRTKKLWDVDASDLNGAWSDSARDAVRNATTGIVAPLFNDGMIDYSAPNISHIGGRMKAPWIYYHTVIEKIFETAGYEKSGDIFSDPAYLALAMPLSLSYMPGFLEAKSFSAAAPGDQVIVNPASLTEIEFSNVSYNGADAFYDGTSKYTIVNADTTAAYFYATFKAQVTIEITGGGSVDLVLEKAGVTPLDDTITGISASGTYELSLVNPAMADGNEITVKVIKNTGTPTISITSGVFYNQPWTEVIGDNFTSTINPAYVYFGKLFPDINQIDFLKDFCVRFNVKMTERNGVIVCKTMDEIFADTAGTKDWTTKRIPGMERLNYAFPGLGQSNYFTYSGDQLTPNLSDDYGMGLFTIDNSNLSESQTIYNSQFLLSETDTFAEVIFMASVATVWENSDTEYKDKFGIRLMFLRDNEASEPDVIYNATPRSDYKVAYFVDPRYDYSMHWAFFIERYYTKFAAFFQKAKIVTRNYRLSDIDVHTFDQLAPVFDSGERFIVTRIINYRSGQATEVELFKIN